ncbi:MAG: amidohydrolase family protein [Candidatus Velthaea sp.]
MRSRLPLVLAVLLLPCTPGHASAAPAFSPIVKAFVAIDDPVVAVENVRVIDGTGSAPRERQTAIFAGGTIAAIGAAAATAVPANAKRVDGNGMTLLPGYVGTHNHLYYVSGRAPDGFFIAREMPTSFPRLYLAAGVTTMRTTGSQEPFTDLNLKRAIDAGKAAGPSIDVTAPYITGPTDTFLQMDVLKDADDARRTVAFWADRGATSFKAYTDITHAELAAAIDEAHKRGLKVAGHLCSIGFREAAELGIDSLEHGLFVDTELDPQKQPDRCPSTASARAALERTPVDGPAIRATIAALVQHHVAISSTLAIFESFGQRPLSARTLAMLDGESLADVTASHARAMAAPRDDYEPLLKKEMAFERAFARAGGLLTTGPDPTGFGGVIAGFGDQRGIELLVEAGFTPVEAIRIATRNGAQLLGRLDSIGTLERGKHADAILIKGNPAANIADIENVVYTFKDGVAYDSGKLIESVRGLAGRR